MKSLWLLGFMFGLGNLRAYTEGHGSSDQGCCNKGWGFQWAATVISPLREETWHTRTAATQQQQWPLPPLLTTLSKDSPEVHRNLEARALKGRTCTEPVPLVIPFQAYLLKFSLSSRHSPINYLSKELL